MDANGVLAAVLAGTGTVAYLRVTPVAQDVPPPNTASPRDENGAWASAYDPATNSLRVTGV